MITGCQGQKELPSVLIGMPVALSGPQQETGKEILQGVELAIADVEDTGVAGRKIELLYNDTASKPERARALARRLVAFNKVAAMIGGDPGAADRQIAEICQNWQPRIAMIAPGESSARSPLTKRSFIPLGSDDAARAQALARFAAGELRATTVAILGARPDATEATANEPTAFSTAFTEVFREKGRVILNKAYPRDKEAWDHLVSPWKMEPPGAVLLLGRPDAMADLRQRLHQAGIKDVKFLVASHSEIESDLFSHREALAGAYLATSFSASDPDPAVQDFVKKFQDKYQESPRPLAASGYDAARMLFEAMRQANSTEPAKVSEQLAKMTQFAGVSGPITIDDRGDPKRTVIIVRAEADQWQFQQRMKDE
jgi:branched-chain amino acid transport system substrate-binding protein